MTNTGDEIVEECHYKNKKMMELYRSESLEGAKKRAFIAEDSSWRLRESNP